RQAHYAVVRPAPSRLEGFVLDHAIFVAWSTLEAGDGRTFARRLLAPAEPRTSPGDVGVVLRWFGAQRPPARLLWLPGDAQAAADAIEGAVDALMREA